MSKYQRLGWVGEHLDRPVGGSVDGPWGLNGAVRVVVGGEVGSVTGATSGVVGLARFSCIEVITSRMATAVKSVG